MSVENVGFFFLYSTEKRKFYTVSTLHVALAQQLNTYCKHPRFDARQAASSFHLIQMN